MGVWTWTQGRVLGVGPLEQHSSVLARTQTPCIVEQETPQCAPCEHLCVSVEDDVTPVCCARCTAAHALVARRERHCVQPRAVCASSFTISRFSRFSSASE